MNSERWQKVKGLFDALVELAPNERERFLDKSCGTDDGLRREIENLLDSFENAESFLEQPAVTEVASVIIKVEAKNLEAGRCFGHYEILRHIGAGGMGEVYLAQDKKLDRKVAVKILNESFAKHESNLRRFTQEAKAASALNHPNILVIHEIGVSEDANYIVSEFIEGVTLREIINTERRQDDGVPKLSEMLDIAVQIAGALSSAHAAHIVHRDIKPENIMVRSDGYVKILDFGLAKLVEQKVVGLEDETAQQNQTAKGVILGTVNYMSPEQAKGEQVDRRTDIFSFGVLFYEMIAGRTPFAGNTMSETFANLINAEPQPLARYAANVPDELQRVVSKMLKKNKEERYQTAKDLLIDLKNLQKRLEFETEFNKFGAPSGDIKRGEPETQNLEIKLTDEKPKGTPNEPQTALLFIPTTNARENLTADSKEGSQQTFEQKPKAYRITPASVLLGLLLLASIGVGLWFYGNRADNIESIAVMPFVNESGNADVEYLSDGITDLLINSLSELPKISVKARSSVFRYKGKDVTAKQIVADLNVQTILNGRVVQRGDDLTLYLSLVDGRTENQIWGKQYNRKLTNLVSLQSEIARDVSENLKLKLSGADRQRLAKSYTTSPEAYQLYLRGRYHYFKLTLPEIRKSIVFYQQAIDLDPNYALAYAGMADAYRTLSITNYVPSKEVCPQAKALATRALEIDESLAEARIVLGWVGFLCDWNWTAAESELKKAIELAPNNSDAHRAYAHLLSNAGRHDEAIAEGRRARELEPLTLITNTLEGQFLFYAGRDNEAIDRLKKTLELDPNFWVTHNILARVYIRQGRFDEAIAELNKAIELSGGKSTEPITQLGYALAKSGNRERAQATLAELKSLAAVNYVPAYSFAIIYNGLGEREEALNYLEKSLQEREVQMSFIKIDTRWDWLRAEPRFVDLMKQMNFE